MSTQERASAPGADGWLSYHLFYHDGLETPLRRCVKPLVVRLHGRGWLKQFFFVRYGLGGPHVRLRLMPAPGCAQEVGDFIWQEVAGFFERYPSLRHKRAATILKENKLLLANDSHETDDTVYPDNSLVESPFRPETERYGGAALLPHSFEFFAFSSIAALCALDAYAAQRRGLQMTTAARMLLKLAFGFAGSAEEFGALVGYGVEWSRESVPEIILLADQLYERQRHVMRRLVVDEARSLALGGAEDAHGGGDGAAPPRFWTLAAGRFARLISGADAATRHRVFGSHLHMTANRFGLKNTDEFYLSRLLVRALDEQAAVSAVESSFRERAGRRETWDETAACSSRLLETAFGFLRAEESLPRDQAEPSFSA